MKRRDFIKLSALASGSVMIPAFLKGFERKTGILPADNGKILVVIQLSGGNDGLNTIVPYTNDVYYRLRPGLALGFDDTLKLNDELAMNSALRPLYELYEQGNVSIINSVGYPNPNRSHFRSMDIWHTASNPEEYLSSGWIGRYLDAECEGCDNPRRAIEVDDTLGLALKGEKMKGIALQNPGKLYKATKDEYLRSLAENYRKHSGGDSNLHYLYKTLIETTSSADYIYEKSTIYKSKGVYPPTELGRDLKTTAELIISGLDTRVYYASLTGFDTHVFQKNKQNQLLGNYAAAVGAFVKDLKENHRFQDVMILTFSEFGRRVKQNRSGGTDHGTANNLFVIGGKLSKAGVYNQGPDLYDLEKDDLKYKVDFRNVYATILRNWLGADDRKILRKEFEMMKFA